MHPLGTFPRGESTSSARRRTKPPTRNRFLVTGKGKSFTFFFLFRRGFRLCGGDQRAFRSPFGNLRALAAKGWRKKTDSLWKARERPSLLLPVLQRISPLRRRPKGFPVALWKPSGPLLRMGLATKNRFLAAVKENAFPAFSCMYKTVLKIQQKEPDAVNRTGLFPCHGTTALTRPCRQSE